MRDDFPRKVKDTIAKRVAMFCSNPSCRKPTSGPQAAPDKIVNIGVAAHITAATPRGPRYDKSLSKEERCSVHNAIWLCQNCGKLVDNDGIHYSVALLRAWKACSEEMARLRVEGKKSKRRQRLVMQSVGDEPIEDVPCPKCKQIIRQRIGKLPGSMDTLHCPTCGSFHAHRDADGSVFTREWGGSKIASAVTCPRCSQTLRVRSDRNNFKKPCLECESILSVRDGKATFVGPMNAVPAVSIEKVGWQQLLLCPHCGVCGNTIGANNAKDLFARCPKCTGYVIWRNPRTAVGRKKSPNRKVKG